LVLASGLVGCTHNHYYYGEGEVLPIESSAPVTLGKASSGRDRTIVLDETPARVVSRAPSSTRLLDSSLCDDGQTIVLNDPPARVVRRSTPAAGGSRVVISQPSTRSVARSGAQDDWRAVTKRSQVEIVRGEVDPKERQ
jgi:hypothetical protein